MTGVALMATSPPHRPVLLLGLDVEGPSATLGNAEPEASYAVRIHVDAAERMGRAATVHASVELAASLTHSDARPQDSAENTPWVTMELSDERGESVPVESEHFLVGASLSSPVTFDPGCERFEPLRDCNAELRVIFRRSETSATDLTTDVAWLLSFASSLPSGRDEEKTLPWRVDIERIP
jgi:hypothetical protein